MARKNPTSAIRKGYDYQDLWGIKLSINWIKNPSRFKWLKFELTPDELSGDSFAFDDIVLCDQNDLYSVYQVKHKQNPDEDKWSWDSFLYQKNGKKRKLDSLFQKWFKSYSNEKIKGKIVIATFVTNGFPEDDVGKYISKNKIDILKVKDELPNIYGRIKDQLGDEALIDDFFSNLNFLFNQNEIEELEDEIKDFFFKELKATEEGVNNLFIKMHEECRNQYNAFLNIEQIIGWCEFDNPKPLDQNFKIPEDFEFFDPELHDKILVDLQNPEGGIKVISGKPGSGKSTYLSKLNETLIEKDIITIKHHYYLSSEDLTFSERLPSQRVVEAIKAQFKQHSQELEDLANKNSKNISLREFISQLSSYFYKQSKPFIIIIDGLDHVLRYSDDKELKDFIKEICFPQPGLWIVFGTQELCKDYLPQTIFDKCPEDQWIEIKGFNENAFKNIVAKNIIDLKYPPHLSQIEDLNNKLFEITEGNPLHLRYTLHQLKTINGDKIVTVYDCNDLISYGGSIENYYNVLWKQLSDESKLVVMIISSVEFQFTEKQLFELLSSIVHSPLEITNGYSAITHILNENKGFLSIYHNSFELFISQQEEFKQQEYSVKKSIKEWLEESDDDNLKWTELKKLAYDLGDANEILSLDENWLIESIYHPREPKHIISQLNLAAKVAFENQFFNKALKLEKLKSYYMYSFTSADIANSKVWQESFKLKNPDLANIDVAKLSWVEVFKSQNRNIANVNVADISSKHLQLIADIAKKQGYSYVVSETIAELNNMHSDYSYSKKNAIGSEIPLLPISLIKTLVLDHKYGVRQVYTYIKQFEESGWSAKLFEIYVISLLKSHQILKVKELLNFEFIPEERQSILDKCVENDFEIKEQNFLETIYKEDHESLNYICILYLLLNGKEIHFIPPLPLYEEFPIKVQYFEPEKRFERSTIFSSNFILGLIYGLLNKETDLEDWISNTQERWPLEIMSQIFKSSIIISESLKEGDNLPLKCLFENISQVKSLVWPYDRDIYEFQRCLPLSVCQILKIIYLTKCNSGQPLLFDGIELDDIILEKYYSESALLRFIISFDEKLLSEDLYYEYISEEKETLKTLVKPFPERAEHYADLAKLATIYQDDENRNYFLKSASFNLIGYGFHKDMYLDLVLDSVQICQSLDIRKTKEWILKLLSPIEFIMEYTDGDETRYFPIVLTELLSLADQKLVYNFNYMKALEKDEFLIPRIFVNVLRTLKFDKDEDIALALTALDEISFKELESIAVENPKAKEVLEIFSSTIGEIDFSNENNQSSTSSLESEPYDFSLINPESLLAHVESFETYWEKDKFIVEWIEFWTLEKDLEEWEIYNLLTEYLDKNSLKNISSEILDTIYPLTYEYDSDKAFEFVCLAQANSGGWLPYYSDKQKTKKRWEFIKKYYPMRYMDFYFESIKSSHNYSGTKGQYFVPIPHSVEFFSLFGEVELIEKITESSVEFVDCLMADLELPVCKWIDLDVDEIDLLIARSINPSGLVRRGAELGIEFLKEKPGYEEIINERIEKFFKLKDEMII